MVAFFLKLVIGSSVEGGDKGKERVNVFVEGMEEERKRK